MVEKESKEIYSLGVACIFFSSLLAIFFGMGSYMMYNKSGNDSYIAALIGGLISFGIFFIFYYIFANNPKENIYELNKHIFGKVIGNGINIILFISIFIIACVILYNMSSFLNLEYLPDAPTNFLKALILITVIYVSSKSLPEIIKVNQIFVFISIINILINIVGIFPKFDIKNIEPILVTNTTNMLSSVFTYVSLSIVPLFMLLITTKNKIKDKEKIKPTIVKSVIYTNLTLAIIIFDTILVLGKEFISVFRFPEYIGLKQFGLFNIVERIENILSLQLYYNAISLLIFLTYFLVSFLPNTRFKKNYPIIISIFLYIITSIIFKETISFTTMMENYLSYVILIGFMLPVVLIFFKLLNFTKKLRKCGENVETQ